MLFRRIGTTAALTAAATAGVLSFTTSAQAAVFAPTTAVQVRELASADSAVITPSIGPVIPTIYVPSAGTSVGACNFLFSGPSTSPNYTPFRIEGQASAASTRPVASLELSCQLRTAGGGVLGTLTNNLPGAASAVAGDINVNTPGPFQICTMVNAHFVDGGESNPNEVYACQWMQGILG